MKYLKKIRALRCALLLLFVFLASTATASAALPRWVQVTPYGGSILELEQAPSDPAALYAVAVNGRVFASTDGGVTWQRRSRGGQEYNIEDLVVDPFDARTVYARTGGSILLRTQDGGLHWSVITPPDYTAALAVDPRHSRVLYAATFSGLYRSNDRGATWRLAALGGRRVEGVALDPRDSFTIFAAVRRAATQSLEAWKSSDGGAHWTASPLTNATSFGSPRFVFDPARPGTLYFLSSSDGGQRTLVLRSTNGGASWSGLRIAARDLAAAPDGVLFAATERGVFQSTDAGTTWVPRLARTAPPGDALTRVLLSASAPDALLAAGSIGIWTSPDRGETWKTSNRGLRAQASFSVAVAPTEPSTVVTVTGGSIFTSRDRGATWLRAHSYFEGPQPYVIEAIDPRHPHAIYGFGSDGQADFPLKSTNGGRRWIKRPFPYNCDSSGSVCEVQLLALALDSHNPGTVLVAGRYFFRFQLPGEFLLRSDDGFATWDELTALPELGALAIDPESSEVYYGLTCRGLFRSQDAGVTWQEIGNGLPGKICKTGGVWPTALAFDPQNPNRLYVGTPGQGVFASSDRGETFRPLNRGLATARIATILIDPDEPSRLYAGVPSEGVFRWDASRRIWLPLNIGLPLESFAGAIALDPQDPKALYAASPVAGLFRLDLDE